MTGRNTGRSFIIGYGSDQPQRPHHRGAACSFNYGEPCKLGPISPNPDVTGGNGTCCRGEGGARFGLGGKEGWKDHVCWLLAPLVLHH
jgi:hypothetical protein